eukprot:TRINITY_DN27059_c0_g1_i2.p1 TRINITY_DN27059_c0_g1~~TRINITY_DN27059_c0_g1_i2.p1  ORF type:complete len:192 (-),score=15.68 TRINITY_DN27059_c0_g1_i2:28-603(-)
MPCPRSCGQQRQLGILRCIVVQALVALCLVVGFYQGPWRHDVSAPDLNLASQPLGSETFQQPLPPSAPSKLASQLPGADTSRFPPSQTDLELNKSPLSQIDVEHNETDETQSRHQPDMESSTDQRAAKKQARTQATDKKSEVAGSLSNSCLRNPVPRFPDHRNHTKKGALLFIGASRRWWRLALILMWRQT